MKYPSQMLLRYAIAVQGGGKLADRMPTAQSNCLPQMPGSSESHTAYIQLRTELQKKGIPHRRPLGARISVTADIQIKSRANEPPLLD